MLDFNTKKEVLRRLRAKRTKNKLLWLPCVIGELFVKLWYAIVCSIDMALSDRHGNFLGVKKGGSSADRSRPRRQDDIVYVKKPFLGRVVSAVLAFSFIFMMVPDLGVIDFSVFADIEVDDVGNTVIFDGETYTYDTVSSSDEVTYYYKNKEYEYASSKTVDSIGWYVGYGAVEVTWVEPTIDTDFKSVVETAGYNIYLIQTGYGSVIDSQYVSEPGTVCDFTGQKTNINYTVRVVPDFSIPLYQLVTDTAGNMSLALVKGHTRNVDGAKKDQEIKQLNAAMGVPVVEDFENDQQLVIWNQVTQTYGYSTDLGTLPDGYIVYRRTYNGSSNSYGSWQKIATVPYNRYLTKAIAEKYDVEYSESTDTSASRLYYIDSSTVSGAIYDYYVMAYRNVVGSSAYDASDPFTITSGQAGAHSPERLYTTPTAPTSVTVKSNKINTLNVSWTAGKGQNTGYILYRSDSFLSSDMMDAYTPSSGDITQNPYYNAKKGMLDYSLFISDKATEVKRVGTNTLSYADSDSSLINTQTYYYYVIAYLEKGDGNYLFSLPTSASGCINAGLSQPQGLVATPGDGQVTVKWDKVDDADGYKLYITKVKNNDGSTTGCGTTTAVYLTKNTYTHVGLLNNEVYSYQVRAYINATSTDDTTVEDYDKVLSDYSEKRTVTVGVQLENPQDMKLTTKDGQITVSWAKVDGAQGYELYYKKDGSNSWTMIDLSKTSFTHTGLNNGDTYSYYVKAYKTVNGVKVYSDDSVIVSTMVGVTLDAPKDFKVTTTDGKATLTWTKVKGAEGYVIYAYNGSESRQIDVSKVKYEHSGLTNGDTWTYYIRAYKTVNGERFFSDATQSITVTIGVSLSAAVDLIATAGNHQIDLTWTKVNGAEGYVVYLYDESTMEFEPLTVTSKTKYSHVGLRNGKEYTYMVAPFKTINGERYYGEYSMAVSAIPTTGSNTDIDRTLDIEGTTPYGISHSEYISAKANHEAFDESVDVYFTTNKESTAAVKDVLRHYANGLSSFIIYPFDISIYKDGTLIEVTPNEGYSVTVTMPVPDKLIAYRDYITVVHINEEAGSEEGTTTEWYEVSDQRLEVLPCAILDIDNVWCVQFVCSSFSPYAFVIYKEHINDVSSGGGVMDGSFAGTFNSGMLLFTTLPDIMPNNRKLKVVECKKKYRIKNVTAK